MLDREIEKWFYGIGGLAAGIGVMLFYIAFLQYRPPTPPEADELASMMQTIKNQQHTDEQEMESFRRHVEDMNDKMIVITGSMEDDIAQIRTRMDSKESK